MKNKILNFKTWFYNKWGKNSIYLGLMKGYSISTLPISVERFYNNIFIRILRVIGGICLVLVLTNGSEKLSLPSSIHTIIIALAFLQSIQILIIMIIKLIFGLYTLIYNRKIFEVRNSPLNKLASSLGQIVFCMKYGCIGLGSLAGVIAACSSFDSVLEAGGRDRFFIPLLGGVYSKTFGDVSLKTTEKLIDELKDESATPYSEVLKLLEQVQNMDPSDRLRFMDELNASIKANPKK